MARVERGSLPIADLSGYTHYMASIDLDAIHVVCELLDTVATQLSPFEVLKFEGDAVFCQASTAPSTPSRRCRSSPMHTRHSSRTRIGSGQHRAGPCRPLVDPLVRDDADESVHDPSQRSAIASMIESSASNPELEALHRAFLDGRTDPITATLGRAVDARLLDSRTDMDLLTELVAAPVFVRAFLRAEPLDRVRIELLVQQGLGTAGLVQ